MCGIIGIASKSTVHDRRWIDEGRDAMRHRGPDDAGSWWSADGCVGLGHRRLSIIDLSPAGHQPMQDHSGRLCIAFNGEIYNFSSLRTELAENGHIFSSHTDTEVILAAYREWGTDCLSRLDGMFAFALYDGSRRQLFMARDRAGEKPLFYAQSGRSIRFASELKGLMADPAFPRRMDPEALDCYLTMGFVPGERCMLQGANKLPPAHALLFDLEEGTSRIWRYWQLPDNDPQAENSADITQLLDELDSLLEASVRRQLIADVPVGVLLSGGVDSSLIAAMAVRASPKVKTFTIRFPGHGQHDETEHARLIARHFATDHIELEAGASTVDLLPLLVRQFDEPLVDSSMIPTYLVSKLVRQHCTVALGGDGGDELFGGYVHYNRMLWIQQRLSGIPLGIRAYAARVAGKILPVGFKGRKWLQGLETDFRKDLPLISAASFDRSTRQSLMASSNQWPLVAEGIYERKIPQTPDLLQRTTRMDFTHYLPDGILVKVDRASMLNSLEVRAPLLSHHVIEFAFGKVPSRLKATPSGRKILLKMLASRLLPPEFDYQRKQGFTIPLGSWLQSGPWQKMFSEVLMDSDNRIFCKRSVKQLLDGQARGLANSERLFSLVMLELWRKEYQISL